jgi:hypothetical protein
MMNKEYQYDTLVGNVKGPSGIGWKAKNEALHKVRV